MSAHAIPQMPRVGRLVAPRPPRTGPSVARHRSTQVVGTPRNFLDAVERRFGPMVVDLAATAENAKAAIFVTPEQDSLSADWSQLTWGNRWLNPPFGAIAPWAEKCARAWYSPSSPILLLVPASIGANWFAEHVYEHALVLALRGRVTFEGHTQPYPKDLILAVYGWPPGFECWDWRRAGRAAT